MHRTRLFFALQCILWGIPLPANAANTEMALNSVWLNGVDRVIESLVLQQDGQRYMECEVLQQLGLQQDRLQKHSAQTQFCSVTTNEIQSEQDFALQAIKLTVPASYFIDAQLSQPHAIPSKAELGGFLNYDVLYARYDNYNELNGLAELGIFKDYWIFKNGMMYRKEAEQDQDKLLRLNTSFEIEFPSRYQRLTLGDNTSVYNPLLDTFRFGGVSFGSNFSSYPDFIYWNVPTLRGSAVLPSTVDLYINGINLYQQQVTPGHYTLNTGANIQQSGEAQVVVEDVLGNRTVQSFPVYVTTQLLKPGLNEYNFSAGKLRYDYDYVSDDYREFFGNLYFRRGITDSTTLGTNLSYSKDVQNVGLLWTQSLSKYALLDTHAASSHSDWGDGYTFGASLSRNGSRLALGASHKYYSPEYRGLGYSDMTQTVEYDNLAYVSIFNIPFINTLNVNYLERRYHPNANNSFADSQMLTVGFSRMFGRQTSLSFSYYKDLKVQDSDGAYLTLNYQFDQRRSAQLSHNFDEQTQLRYAQSSLTQNGVDYTLAVRHQQAEGDVGVNAYTALKMPMGNLYLSHDESESFSYSQANYQGAVVWLDRKWAMTKYVDNAFALVNVGDIPNVEVQRALTPVGKTNQHGYAFVHDIVPYVNYDVSFDQDQLDMYDSFEYSSQKVIGMNQRGYKVNFPVQRTGLIILRLLTPDQQTFVQGSEVYLSDDATEFVPVGSDGKVHLYGVKAGSYMLKVKTKGGKVCHSSLEVPQLKAGTVPQTRQLDLICQ